MTESRNHTWRSSRNAAGQCTCLFKFNLDSLAEHKNNNRPKCDGRKAGLVDEGSRGGARRAESSALAGECDQMLVAVGVALDSQKAVLEQAALQVVVELPLDERGQ